MEEMNYLADIQKWENIPVYMDFPQFIGDNSSFRGKNNDNRL